MQVHHIKAIRSVRYFAANMLRIYSELKELLDSLTNRQHPPTIAVYQRAYLRFRGLVVDAAAEDEVYQQWAQQYLTDVSDETGEVVKLHETTEELKGDIAAFIRLMERTELY